MASVKIYPPCDSEYPGYLRLLYLIQQGTQSSTPKTSQMGYLLTEAMIWLWSRGIFYPLRHCLCQDWHGMWGGSGG